MKILLISMHGTVTHDPDTSKPDTGGQTTHVINLARELTAKGNKVCVATRAFEGHTESKTLDDFEIRPIKCGPKEYVDRTGTWLYAEDMANELASYNEDWDIIHSHYYDAGLVAMHMKDGGVRARHVHTPHSLAVTKAEALHKWRDPDLMARAAHEFRVLDSCDLYLACSELHTRWAGKYGRSAKFVPPIVSDAFRPDFAVFGRKSLTYRAITIGRNDISRGLENIVRGVRAVWSSDEVTGVDRKLTLDIVSPLTSAQKDLLIHLAGHHADKLSFLYPMEQHALAGILPLYDIYIHGSLYDAFGLAPAEAMACGVCPLVLGSSGFGAMLSAHKRAFHSLSDCEPGDYRLALDNMTRRNVDTAVRRAADAAFIRDHCSPCVVASETLRAYNEAW